MDLFRFEIAGVEDAGDQQLLRGYGLPGEELAKVWRVMPHGFASHPPAGAHGIGVAVMGRRDRVAVIGGEVASLRQRNLPMGGTAIYDHLGNIVSLVEAEARFVHAQKIVLKVGASTVTITGAGIAIESGQLTHNGVNISASHVHTGVVPGGANTGTPA